MQFPKEAAAYLKATRALTERINGYFPPGMRVYVNHGRGVMRGTVVAATFGHDVLIKPDNAKGKRQVRRKHYSLVWREE